MSTDISSHLFIRADAGPRVGSGHLVRTMALAKGWANSGGAVTFITRGENAALVEELRRSGAEIVELSGTHPDSQDLTITMQELRRKQSANPCVVIDGYSFDFAYQHALREAGFLTLVIDDYAHFDRYDADILLNQNLHASKSSYVDRCNADAVLLLGTGYVMLREEFGRYAKEQCEVPSIAKRILVTTGGSGCDGTLMKVLRALAAWKSADTEVVVVNGVPAGAAVSDFAAQSNVSIQTAADARTMADLMCWADLAVSGAGSTCWEMAFMRLPAILLVLAENQWSVADALHRSGAAFSLGSVEAIDADDIRAALSKLATDVHQRAAMIRAAGEIVDGQGVGRVVSAIASLAAAKPRLTGSNLC